MKCIPMLFGTRGHMTGGSTAVTPRISNGWRDGVLTPCWPATGPVLLISGPGKPPSACAEEIASETPSLTGDLADGVLA